MSPFPGDPPLSAGAIAGIAVGCAVFLIAIIIIAVLVSRQKKKKQGKITQNNIQGLPI